MKNYICFLFLLFNITYSNADTAFYIDFKYILNKSDAGKKAQNFLKSKLENGLKNLSAKEKIQEEEKKLFNKKKSNIT